jgi:hypothetical protein
MPCTGNLGQLIKNVASVVEANTLHGICPSSGINLIGGRCCAQGIVPIAQ